MSNIIVKKQWYLIDHLKRLAKKHGATRQEIHEVYIQSGVQHGSIDYEQWREDRRAARAFERKEKYNG